MRASRRGGDAPGTPSRTPASPGSPRWTRCGPSPPSCLSGTGGPRDIPGTAPPPGREPPEQPGIKEIEVLSTSQPSSILFGYTEAANLEGKDTSPCNESS